MALLCVQIEFAFKKIWSVSDLESHMKVAQILIWKDQIPRNASLNNQIQATWACCVKVV